MTALSEGIHSTASPVDFGCVLVTGGTGSFGSTMVRRLLRTDVSEVRVLSRDEVVDLPTMWVHNITNTGGGELVTLFWPHTIFDPDRPDTFAEPVEPTAAVRAGVSAEVTP